MHFGKNDAYKLKLYATSFFIAKQPGGQSRAASISDIVVINGALCIGYM